MRILNLYAGIGGNMTNKTSALKEEDRNMIVSALHDFENNRTSYQEILDIVNTLIRKTQEADNILMKKDADTIHNQRIELLKLQSKIKELEEKNK